MKKVNFLVFFLTSLLFCSLSSVSTAIPVFAKRENLNCNNCHSAVPALNGFGRNYKLQGYVLYDQRPSRPNPRNAGLSLNDILPISAGIISRPYDKKDSGNTKTRAIHEVELMVAGNIAEGFSGFIELEAEDEEDFNIEASIIQGSYRFNSALNLQVFRAPGLYFDPYNSYTNSRRITINRNAIIDQSFGGADNNASLRRNRQNLTVFGKSGAVFYGMSFSGVANDNEGEDADTLIARIAYDFSPDLMLGALLIDGSCSMENGGGGTGGPCEFADRDYSRTAIDGQWTTLGGNLTLNAVYMQADDDLVSGLGEESNDSFNLQGFYNIVREGRPLFTPIARYDRYEFSNGQYEVDLLTLGISHYLRENINLRAEYADIAREGPISDDSRFTLQINAYF